MPPNKWNDKAERDLVFALLLTNAGGDEKGIKPQWEEIEKQMTNWGHTFTKDALSQRWSKHIMKAFREDHKAKVAAAGSASAPAAPETPGPKATGSAKATGSTKATGSAKRKGKAAAAAAAAELDNETPSKKAKLTASEKGKNVAVNNEDMDEDELAAVVENDNGEV